MDTSKNRTYRTAEIAVTWEPALCIHSAACIRGLPQVFNPLDRPWVHIDEASASEIAETVSRCPTGALHAYWTDGTPAEEPLEPPAMLLVPNGPLYVRGRLRIEDPEGGVIREDTRLALCRCGQSANKPFCDNSHRQAGFRDAGRLARTTAAAERAEDGPPRPSAGA